MTLRCSTCTLMRPWEDFYPAKHSRGFEYRCKECEKIRDTKHRPNRRKPQGFIAKTHKHNSNTHSRKVRAHIQTLKENSPCLDCGHSYPAEVMDYDHVRGVKLHNISSLANHSLARVMAEIVKCDLVCANCHRIRHINRRKAFLPR